MPAEQMRQETIKYVRILETNYNDKISSLKMKIEKQKKYVQTDRIQSMNKETEKQDLERLFVQSVEEVRKNIVRRRLKNEFGKNRRVNLPRINEEELEFDLTISKLADLAKGRVKFEEFTSSDRNHLIELFVNNEQVLLSAYASIFAD